MFSGRTKALTQVHADRYSIFSAERDEAQVCFFIEDFSGDLFQSDRQPFLLLLDLVDVHEPRRRMALWSEDSVQEHSENDDEELNVKSRLKVEHKVQVPRAFDEAKKHAHDEVKTRGRCAAQCWMGRPD